MTRVSAADKIRVLHVIGGGEFGGAERYVLDLVRRLDPDAFSPMVACFYEGRLSRALAGSGLPVRVMPQGPGGLPALVRYMREGRPRIVHTHGVRGNLFGRLAARACGVRAIVTTVHSHLSLDYPNPLRRGVYRSLEALTAPLVRRFVAVSRPLADLLVRQGRIRPGRIVVVGNGVDLEVFKPVAVAGDRLRAELGLAGGTRLVGLVARLHPVKGYENFLRAAGALAPSAGDVAFLCVGGGEADYRRRLEVLAAEQGLAGRVFFLGEREDVAEVLAGLDVVAVPSVYEGFSLATVEAMACGVPVVASRAGGVTELIVHGENGLLAVPGDHLDLAAKIAVVLADGELARRLAQGGLATAQGHSAAAFAARMGGLYRQVAAEAGVR